MNLLFGDLSNYNKLKLKYRSQTKKYLKELRNEQENFLMVYKFLSDQVDKTIHLKSLVKFVKD